MKGEVIVTFGPNVSHQRRILVARRAGGQIATSRLSPRAVVVKLPASTDVVAAATDLRRDPAVAWAEPNWYYQPTLIPNDPNLQWGLTKTQVTTAWDLEPGGDPATVIAIVDSGIDANHPDLDANLWTNTLETPANGIDDDGNGRADDIYGWDFVQNDNVPQDGFGHGTHVAGIAAAEWDNGAGGSGVCPLCSLMILRAGDNSGRLTSARIVAAIRYAADEGAEVINLSLGGPQWSRVQRDAIAYANSQGALVVAAAGNESRNNDTLRWYQRGLPDGPSYPASYDLAGLISVAASNSGDRYAGFSNVGANSVDIAAPGVGIFSTVPDDTYAVEDGTSMASLFVAGVAGLLRSANPGWTAIQTKNAIMNRGDNPDAMACCLSVSDGRVNAYMPLAVPNTSNATPRHDGVMSGAVPITYRKNGAVSVHDMNDIYKIRLRAGRTYAALLRVPARRDFDLFVWRPGAQDTFPTDYGCGGISCFLRAASVDGKGVDEYVKFKAGKTGVYYFHVNAFTGKGRYTLFVGVP